MAHRPLKRKESLATLGKAGAFSPTYGLCSVGYVQERHERLLGRAVEVDLVGAVLRGGKRRTFRMTIAEGPGRTP